MKKLEPYISPQRFLVDNNCKSFFHEIMGDDISIYFECSKCKNSYTCLSSNRELSRFDNIKELLSNNFDVIDISDGTIKIHYSYRI